MVSSFSLCRSYEAGYSVDLSSISAPAFSTIWLPSSVTVDVCVCAFDIIRNTGELENLFGGGGGEF